MRKPNKNSLLLFVVTAGLMACSTTDDEKDLECREWNLATAAIKIVGGVDYLEDSDEAGTRSLFWGGQTGNRFISLWDVYDVAQVYDGGSLVGTLVPDETGLETTTLSGTLTGSFSTGKVLTLYMPSPNLNYEGQNGSFGNMARYYDFVSTTVAVASVSGSSIKTDPLTFSSLQAYMLLKFRDENNSLLQVKKLTIAAESGKIVLTKSLLGGETTYTSNLVINTVKEASSVNDYPTDVYVSILNEYPSADNYTFIVEAQDGNTYKSKTPWNRKFNNGEFVIARRATVCATVDVEMSTGITPPVSDDADVDVQDIVL